MHMLCGATSAQYTAHSVVSIATPDFSMPYNVCCLSSTLLAVFFGGMLNILTARPRVNAVQAMKKGAKMQKAGRVVVLLCLFSFLAVYLDPELQGWVVAHLQKYGYQHDSLF